MIVIFGIALSGKSNKKLNFPMEHEIIDSWLLGRLQYKATGEFICILVSENAAKEEVYKLAKYYRENKQYKYLSLIIANNKAALKQYLKNDGPASEYLTNSFIRKHFICTIGVNIVNNGSSEPHYDDEIIWRGFDERTNTTIYERELSEEEIKIKNEKSKEIDYEAKYKKMVSEGASIDLIIKEMKTDKLSYQSQVWFLMKVAEINFENASKIISNSGTLKP